MPSHFMDLAYLATGNPRQRRVLQLLQQHQVFEALQAFGPLLAGTIPIGIDIPSSDIDIICGFGNKEYFKKTLLSNFAHYPEFSMHETVHQQLPTIIANVQLEDHTCELFGQPIAAHEQPAFRHMLIEHHLLLEYGAAFREKVIVLKLQGIKTEAAFARLLNLAGDPYEALLKLTKQVCTRAE